MSHAHTDADASLGIVVQHAIPRKSLPPPRRKNLPVLPAHARLGGWMQRRGRRLVHGWWAWELIAAAVSVAATATLIALLAAADRHPQETWAVGSTQLTLNTLVALVATVIRASLLLVVAGALNQSAWNWFAARADGAEAEGRPLQDLETFSEAAANTWNCMKLLWRTKGRYIASIGALVMILMIAFDTFVQLVLVIQTQPVPIQLAGANLSAANILPYAVSYNGGGNAVFGTDQGELQLESLLTAGILKTNTTPPSASCPAGSCTWPVTPTIGICSECTDISASANVTTNSSASCRVKKYTLPSIAGEIIGSGAPNTSVTMSSCGGETETEWRLESVSTGTNVNGLPEHNTTIADLYAFGTTLASSTRGVDAAFLAYHCSWWFCVKGYSAQSSQGTTTQQAISTTAELAHGEYGTEGSYWQVFDQIPPALNVEETAVFRVDEELRQTLGAPFDKVLQGTYTAQIGVDLAQAGASSTVASIFFSASGSLANLTSLVQSISDAMTSYIRTSGPVLPPDERYAPTAMVEVPVVGVRWAWLAYPLALELAGLSFLGLTMLATRRRRVRPWKGHRVPLLLAELDDGVRQLARGGLDGRTALDDRVGALRVRLEFDGDDGIVFRRVEREHRALNDTYEISK